MNNNDFSFSSGRCIVDDRKKGKTMIRTMRIKKTRQSAVITMRTFFVKYYFKVEVVLG